MCRFIGFEDLAANALIDLVEDSAQGNRISFKQLIEYGNTVERVYNDNYQDEVILVISNNATSALIRNYSEFFTVEREGITEYFSLREGVNPENLREEFRARLPIELLYSFTSKQARTSLGIVA